MFRRFQGDARRHFTAMGSPSNDAIHLCSQSAGTIMAKFGLSKSRGETVDSNSHETVTFSSFSVAGSTRVCFQILHTMLIHKSFGKIKKNTQTQHKHTHTHMCVGVFFGGRVVHFSGPKDIGHDIEDQCLFHFSFCTSDRTFRQGLTKP